MKRGAVAEAIQFAYESLKERSLTWGDRKSSGSAEAFLWESIVVSDRMLGGPIVKPKQVRIVINVSPEEEGGPPDLYYDDEKGTRLIGRARKGNQVAKQLLCELAADHLETNRDLPPALKEFLIEVLRAKDHDRQRKRGLDPFANHPRNFDIACTILNVASLRGFKATRNRATETDSACSVVVQALARLGIHMSEANVEKIWERFAPDFR